MTISKNKRSATVGSLRMEGKSYSSYAAKFVKEYIEESKPRFAVGEYWDNCEYSPPDYRLNYNQNNHRQRIINWIDSTGGLCAAIDFTRKGILQEAVKGELWRLRDPEGKPPGVMGWRSSRSVTFIENHDTGSTQVLHPLGRQLIHISLQALLLPLLKDDIRILTLKSLIRSGVAGQQT
ncbi:probable alpha-amylase 2 isoform X2 [Phragmites australis]|uniref:probable alpha-amylase 2 isoform X2 n=1 Tax=Phragmites australis TaxID=29695 RepID=UPI002D76817D|nr:probable alpha-amylase 2 isoform X2 [Phragmites australis]